MWLNETLFIYDKDKHRPSLLFFLNKSFLFFSLYLHLSSVFLKRQLHNLHRSRKIKVKMGSVVVYYGWSWTNQPTNKHKGIERRENIGGFISETPSRKQMATWVNWGEFNNRTIDKGVGEPQGQRREWFKEQRNLGGKCQLWFLGRQMGE